jgi:hypothetical protein
MDVVTEVLRRFGDNRVWLVCYVKDCFGGHFAREGLWPS